MSLRVDIGVQRGALDLQVQFEAPAGSCAVLVGPNGAGKTTVLWGLAGLLEGVEGTVALGDTTLLDSSASTFVRPQDRNAGMVFQSSALFPHLSVLNNAAYGLHGQPTNAAHAAAQRWLDRCGAGDLASRMPHELSGGQARRVALARALARSPQLLLLDEPLAGLDVEARTRATSVLRDVLDGFDGVAVVVAHDLHTARAVGDTLVVIEEGRVTERGRLDEVTRAATSPHLKAMLATEARPQDT